MIILVMVVAYRMMPLFLGNGSNLPDIQPIGNLEPLSFEQPAATAVVRNPFDAGGMHWSDSGKATDGIAAGPVNGIILLPGLKAVLAEGRTIKFGETFEGGKLVGVKGEQLIIRTSEGSKRIDLPGANRPHLSDLSRP